LWTQFLGAFNDNVCRLVISMVALAAAGATGTASGYLPWVTAVFALPFLLFSGYAGQLADTHSKRTVLVVTTTVEVAAMATAIVAFTTGRFEWMLAVLFLTATQSAFFSPAKYGIVPEIVPDRALSRANGLLEMSTFAAIVLGSAAGAALYAAWDERLATVGVALTAVAALALVTSRGIPHVAPASREAALDWNPWAGLSSGLTRLRAERTLWMTALGVAWFWFLGALLQMALLAAGRQVMGLGDGAIAAMSVWLAVGVGTGSLAAGRWSGDKVELGLVPFGSFGMGLGALALVLAMPSFPLACTALLGLGFSGGLFTVPLHALLQQKPAAGEKGSVFAVSNLLSTVAILMASLTMWYADRVLEVSPARVLVATGAFQLVASGYVLYLLPDFFIRFSLILLTHTFYRLDVRGLEHVPVRGPALLVCNHLSHVDGFLVGASLQRFVRFMVYRPYFNLPVAKQLLTLMRAIPVAGGNRQEMRASIAQGRAELEAGHIVCIFAEGAISRTGNLLPFRRGFEHIVDGLDVPVIPVCLDQLWGSIFSFKDGRFLWKRPQQVPYPVSVTFGAPMPAATTAADARQAIAELASEAMSRRLDRRSVLHRRTIRTAKRRWRRLAMADATGRTLTFGRMLVGALLLSRWVRAHCEGQRIVGLLLPASVPGALANLAVLIAGKVPVNLNFTAGREAIAAAIAQCGITTVLSSKTFLARAKLDAPDGTVALEDVLPSFTAGEKLATLVAARLMPSSWLIRRYAPENIGPDDLATVIFSSGSTGQPKGVMLSHRNVIANLEGMGQVFWVTPEDRMIGVLPFFHSFGFTGTLWFPLVSGFATLFVPNPMDAKAVGELADTHAATILIGTPTFYQAYIRKCEPHQFRALRYGVVGAERLREPIARAFREKFGIDLLEGYGCTEMAPVVSVNVPDVAHAGQTGSKAGTVGHPLPGVVIRVVDPETKRPVGAGEPGLLLVKGPNRMLGYLGNPEATKSVFDDGWYVTGDIGMVDDDGFIKLTDRLSRFSKIAGEMVPHLKIEEIVVDALDDPNAVVTAVPDEDRGERLVVFYTADVPEDDVWAALNQSELPKLWVPKRENVHRIEAIPVLGTGKVDLRGVKQLALERHGPPTSTS
jgi:acyl-[acyl-carrier-protein]-phospholipid O-acyltransferase/long-chain-fatty-acid--[acyl-carrier-protein] ligase